MYFYAYNNNVASLMKYRVSLIFFLLAEELQKVSYIRLYMDIDAHSISSNIACSYTLPQKYFYN